MKLHKLSIKDKEIFNKFLKLSAPELSVYAFENIYIWKGLFDISWTIIRDNLCVFLQDKIGAFLYLAPLGRKKNAEVIRQAFTIMDKFNHNRAISRIENVEEKDVEFYRSLGYETKFKSCDYLCKRTDLAQLRGDKFKSKRACFNYFTKHYQFAYLPFSFDLRSACLKLYKLWMGQRKTEDNIYQGMLRDNLKCLEILLRDYKNLNLTGRVVKIAKEIKGFTFGFRLNKDTFCILYEITDLSIKGLSQFIFRAFCSELKNYQYINVMDDSGLENLKKVKLSYRPVRLIPAYIVTRKNAEEPG